MKDKALQELRKLYKDCLYSIDYPNEFRDNRTAYQASKYYAIEVGLLTFQEIETMETEQNDLIG